MTQWRTKWYLSAVIVLACWQHQANAQHIDLTDLQIVLRQKDSLLFSVGFNTCDMKPFHELLSDDFEFYHDEAGITTSKPAFIAEMETGLCKLPYKPRRQLVAGSLRAFPLMNKGTLYGAVQTGEHVFYAAEAGKPEYLTSSAKFTAVWLLEHNKWRLSRVLSYDHRKP